MCPAASDTTRTSLGAVKASDSEPGLDVPDSRHPSGAGSVAAAPGYRDESDCLVLSVSSDGEIVEVISALPRTDSFSSAALRGTSIDAVWPEALAATIKDHLRRVLRSRQARCVQLDDPSRRCRYELIIIAQGRERAMLAVRDVSRVHKELSHLQQLAYGDELTRLPNREWFLAELGQVTESLRLRGGRAAVICLDVRHIDIRGHARSEADAVLKELATRIVHGLRGVNRADEASDERLSLVARVDAARFGVILPNIKGGEDAAVVASRLADALEQPVALAERQYRVEVTAGIALYPQDGRHSMELYESAVTATEDAVNSLSRKQRFHSGTVHMRALQRQDLELELKTALENNEFTVAYLPIVERSSRRVAAAEALLRWPRRISGSLRIEEVVTAADFTGLMLPIGEWVFATALHQLEHWHSAGCDDLRLAFNVSQQEFSRGIFVDRIEQALQATGMDPTLLMAEITEHLLFRDAMRDFAVCGRLKELGVQVAVDDYGIGVCPFEHLARSPIDVLKIHQRFVSQHREIGSDRAACAAIVALAHELGKTVVAEGVESAGQAQMLEEIGCDYLQGFFFSEPLSADEFAVYHFTNQEAPA